MAVSSRNPRHRMSPWLRLVLWAIPVLFVLLIVGFFVAKSAIDAYLRSDGFRQFVDGKAGGTLHANAELAPLNFAGSTIFSDRFHAKGGPDAAFADLQIKQI